MTSKRRNLNKNTLAIAQRRMLRLTVLLWRCSTRSTMTKLPKQPVINKSCSGSRKLTNKRSSASRNSITNKLPTTKFPPQRRRTTECKTFSILTAIKRLRKPSAV